MAPQAAAAAEEHPWVAFEKLVQVAAVVVSAVAAVAVAAVAVAAVAVAAVTVAVVAVAVVVAVAAFVEKPLADSSYFALVLQPPAYHTWQD